MCRWIAYIGKPISIDTLVTKPSHSLMSQSFNSKMLYKPDGGIDRINADGFGLGWYLDREEPGLVKVTDPAWSNENISELCSNLKSPLFMAHIRAASVGAIQRSNSHPFKYKNWLFQHNGTIFNFAAIRRELQFDIAPELFNLLKGTTDSEVIFFLMLTYGLEQNPKKAIEKTIQHITRVCEKNSVPVNFNLSCAISDGKLLYTVRYSSTDKAHSQYYSTHAECMKSIDHDNPEVPKSSVVVVSEPLDLGSEHWIEMPLGSFATFESGGLLRGAKIHIEKLDV